MKKLNETTMLKASLYAALLRKKKEQLTDCELELINLMAQDHEIESLLEQDRLTSIERAISHDN